MNDRMNTIFGWVLGSGIVALGLSSLSGHIFHTERPEELGYVIEGAEEEGGAAQGPSLAEAMASMTPSAGEALFAKCAACHTIEQGGAAGIGPNLWGIVGQPIGSHSPGFAYSSALSGHGGTWDFESLDAWLTSPRAFADGTKMSFAGLSSIEDRAALIVYMNSMGSNLPLPEVVVAAAAEADAAAAEAGAEGEAAAPAEGEAAPAEGEEAAAPEA